PGRESQSANTTAGAEGATAPESLRPPDRPGQATLESRWFATSPKGKGRAGKPAWLKLSGADDSGGATRARNPLETPVPPSPTFSDLFDPAEFAGRHIGPQADDLERML